MGIIEIKQLEMHEDADGRLFETLRCDDKIFDGKFGQNLVSIVKPGIIKGFHLHQRQTDYTTCIKGNIIYVAVRELQGGKLLIEKHKIGKDNMAMIKTLPGIWHGYTPLNDREAIVLYTMDKPYNPKDTDTEEVMPDFFGDVWKI